MKQLKPKIDPEIRDLFGKRNEEEYCQLKANIDLNGQLDDGVVWKETGILLDGHGRMEACAELGRDFRYKTLSFESRQEAIDWVWQNQLGRRNLAKDDRDMLIAVRYKKLKGEKEKQQENKDEIMVQSGPSISRDGRETGDVVKKVAAEAKVSPTTVKRAIAKVESNFCERCQRVGMVKDCPKCAELQATVKKKKKSTKGPAKGSQTVDWQKFESSMTHVVQLSDKMFNHHKDHLTKDERRDYEHAIAIIDRLARAWKKKLTGGGK